MQVDEHHRGPPGQPCSVGTNPQGVLVCSRVPLDDLWGRHHDDLQGACEVLGEGLRVVPLDIVQDSQMRARVLGAVRPELLLPDAVQQSCT